MTVGLPWSHALAEIGDKGLSETRTADEHERAELAAALDLLAVGRLAATYTIRPRGKSGYLLAGTLSAELTQACVVSLEPVPAKVEARFSALFKHEADRHGGDLDFDPIAEEDEPEAIENGRIWVGRIVYEHLASAIDLYPRRPDAVLSYSDPAGGDAAKSSPFAALDKLRRKE